MGPDPIRLVSLEKVYKRRRDYKRKEIRTQTLKEDQVKTQRGDYHVEARDLRGNQSCSHPDLGLLDSRTKKMNLLFQSPCVQFFVMAAPVN